MTENLDFVLTASTTLTPDTSNVTDNTTLNASTETLATHTYWTASTDNPTAAEINSIRSYTESGATTADGDGNETLRGVYYNWYTATAKSGTYETITANPTKSVCPKNWVLPTISQDVAINETYGITDDSVGYDKIQKFPLSYIMAGVYRGDHGQLEAAGINGYYWSRTYTATSNVARILLMSVNGDTIRVAATSGMKYRGANVRCVAW